MAANLLVLPNIRESANISYNLLKTAAGNGIAVGPILLGCAKPVHILTSSASTRSAAVSRQHDGALLCDGCGVAAVGGKVYAPLYCMPNDPSFPVKTGIHSATTEGLKVDRTRFHGDNDYS